MMQLASSHTAQEAYALVQELQAYLVSRLEQVPSPQVNKVSFVKGEWLRAQGAFGGGARYMARDESVFNRASVNTSQVQYEQDPSRKLASASALSTIVHPQNPLAPSMHMHISWTEMKSGEGYWRIMGDLNPSIPFEQDTQDFIRAFEKVVPDPLCTYGQEQGARYFYIPALQRHRGVAHFYLEEYRASDRRTELDLAKNFGRAVIDAYVAIIMRHLTADPCFEESHRQQQLAYHSLYFLQVLTLDRGTTSGLLVHDENDVGILGSLPSLVDKRLLESWLGQVPDLQKVLLKGLLDCLHGDQICLVDDESKRRLAEYSRTFYRQYPQAQELLARGDKIPPTQKNHS